MHRSLTIVHALFLFAACFCAGCGVPARVDIPGDRVELAMVRGQSYYWHFDGVRPFIMDIDTGSDRTTIAPELAAMLQGVKQPTIPIILTDAGGNSLWLWTVFQLEAFQIGPITFHDVDVDVLDISSLQPAGEPVALGAIVGLGLFRDCLLTLDFPNSKMIVERGELPRENGRDILRYRWLSEGNLEIRAQLAGKPMWVKIDSGFYGPLSISADLAEGMSFSEPFRTVEAGYAILGSDNATIRSRLKGDMVFGQYTIDAPEVHIGGRPHRVLVGFELLRQFRITVDQKNQRIRFTQVADPR